MNHIHQVTLPEAAQTTPAPALSAVMAELRKLIADRLLRTIFAPLIVPLWNYLKRVDLRFASLAIRHAAGEFETTNPNPRKRTPRTTPSAPPQQFPRTPAWLLAALKHEAAYIRIRLEAFLAQPETKALIADCPRSAGTLRYVFFMLGMQDPRPRKPRPKPQPKSKPRIQPDPPPLDYPPLARPRTMAEMCPRAAARWPFHPDTLRAKRA